MLFRQLFLNYKYVFAHFLKRPQHTLNESDGLLTAPPLSYQHTLNESDGLLTAPSLNFPWTELHQIHYSRIRWGLFSSLSYPLFDLSVKECAHDHIRLPMARGMGPLCWAQTGVRKVGKSSFVMKFDDIRFVLSNHVEKIKVEKEVVFVFLFVLSEKGHVSKKKFQAKQKQFAHIGKFLFLIVKFSVKSTIRLEKYYKKKKKVL